MKRQFDEINQKRKEEQLEQAKKNLKSSLELTPARQRGSTLKQYSNLSNIRKGEPAEIR